VCPHKQQWLMTSADGVSKVTTAAFLTSHSISPSIRTSLTPIKKGRQLNTNCTKHFPHPQNKDDNHITPVTTKSSLHLTSPQYPSPHLFLLFTHTPTQYIYRASTHTSQPCHHTKLWKAKNMVRTVLHAVWICPTTLMMTRFNANNFFMRFFCSSTQSKARHHYNRSQGPPPDPDDHGYTRGPHPHDSWCPLCLPTLLPVMKTITEAVHGMHTNAPLLTLNPMILTCTIT